MWGKLYLFFNILKGKAGLFHGAVHGFVGHSEVYLHLNLASSCRKQSNFTTKSFLSWPQDQKYYCKANNASPHVNDHNIQRNKEVEDLSVSGFVLVTTLPIVSYHSPLVLWSLRLTKASCVIMRFERCSDAAAKPEDIGLWSVEVIERLRNTQFAAHKMPTSTCSPEQTDLLFQLNKHMRLSCMDTVVQLRPLNTQLNRINVQY